MQKTAFLLFVLACVIRVSAQNQYSSYSGVIDRLSNLAKDSNVHLSSLGLTSTARNIWCLHIGGEEREQNPAIAIVAGMDLNGLFGTEICLRLAEKLAQEESLLEKVSFYIIPLANPDIYANDPTKIRYEKNTNDQPFDDDRDGQMDEDPFEDLNADNLITQVRVKDPTGIWKAHPEFPGLMVKARIEMGEKGEYQIFSEGFDSDRDGEINEDAKGGINLNRNFTFGYKAFESGAGLYPVSSVEARSVLDMLYDQWNIHTVFSFSGQDNMIKAWKHSNGPHPSNPKIISTPTEKDAEVFNRIAKNYRDIHGIKEGPGPGVKSGGDLLSWAYFHYGRFSFSNQAWTVPKVIPDSGQTLEEDNAELRYARWMKQMGKEDIWVPWQKIDHPDFPEREVEVGGMIPYTTILPPIELADSIAPLQLQFFRELALMLPQIEMHNLQLQKLEGDITRISVDVFNAGILPTHSQLGQKNRWVRKPRIELILNPEEEQVLISGRKTEMIAEPIDGHTTLHRNWLVKGKGSLVLKIGSPICGYSQQVIELK